MWYRSARQDSSPIVTFEIGKGDIIQMSVSPEDAIGEVVDCQSVRPSDIVLPCENLSTVAAVHAHLTNVRLKFRPYVIHKLSQLCNNFAYDTIIREETIMLFVKST